MWLESREISPLPPERIVRLGVAHVPQGRHLFPDLSVRENLLLGAYTRGTREALPRIYTGCSTCSPVVADRVSLPANHLSGGEQLMVALERVLMTHPPIGSRR